MATPTGLLQMASMELPKTTLPQMLQVQTLLQATPSPHQAVPASQSTPVAPNSRFQRVAPSHLSSCRNSVPRSMPSRCCPRTWLCLRPSSSNYSHLKENPFLPRRRLLQWQAMPWTAHLMRLLRMLVPRYRKAPSKVSSPHTISSQRRSATPIIRNGQNGCEFQASCRSVLTLTRSGKREKG